MYFISAVISDTTGSSNYESPKLFPVPGYPNCQVIQPKWIGNGICDGYDYNTVECGFDGGDCHDINKYPNCQVRFPSRVGDGSCDGYEYNTPECGFDGGDCIIPEYPNCHVKYPKFVGDGECDGGEFDTPECGFDGGDCTWKIGNYITPAVCSLSGGGCTWQIVGIVVGAAAVLSALAYMEYVRSRRKARAAEEEMDGSLLELGVMPFAYKKLNMSSPEHEREEVIIPHDAKVVPECSAGNCNDTAADNAAVLENFNDDEVGSC